MGIILHTRNRLEIENEQCLILSPFEKNYGAELERKYGSLPGFSFRTGASGIYNCFGLVFASRRTCIHQSTEIRKIIEDDGYREIPREEVKPGDIILYYTEAGDDIQHSAIVIVEPREENLWVPMVLSKIGKWKEAIHPANAIQNYPPLQYAKYYRIRD